MVRAPLALQDLGGLPLVINRDPSSGLCRLERIKDSSGASCMRKRASQDPSSYVATGTAEVAVVSFELDALSQPKWTRRWIATRRQRGGGGP